MPLPQATMSYEDRIEVRERKLPIWKRRMIWRTGTLMLVGLLSGIVGFMLVDREPPIRTLSLSAATKVVQPGGELKVATHIYRYRVCRVILERRIVDKDEVRYQLEPVATAFPGNEGEDRYLSSVAVPRTASVGPARYVQARSYMCNPFHRIWPIVVTMPTVNFTIEGEPATSPYAPIEVVPRR